MVASVSYRYMSREDCLRKIIGILTSNDMPDVIENLNSYPDDDLKLICEQLDSIDIISKTVYGTINSKETMTIFQFCYFIREIFKRLYNLLKVDDMNPDFEQYFGVHTDHDCDWFLLMAECIKKYHSFFPKIYLNLSIIRAVPIGQEAEAHNLVVLMENDKERINGIYTSSDHNQKALFLNSLDIPVDGFNGLKQQDIFNFGVGSLHEDISFYSIDYGIKDAVAKRRQDIYYKFKEELDFFIELLIKNYQKDSEPFTQSQLFNVLLSRYKIYEKLNTNRFVA